jgi:HlyD family secretion protein
MQPTPKEQTMSAQDSLLAGRKPASADYRLPARAGLAVIVAAFGIAAGWAARAPLDSAAIAQGQIEVDSHRKAIQHLEGGIIKEILVKEAEIVRQDQVLFRLEPVQARANAEMLRKQLDAGLAQEARLRAELDGKSEIAFPGELLARGDAPQIAAAIASEQRQFAERRQSIDNQARIFQARIAQTGEDIAGRSRQESALAAQIDNMARELASVAPLAEKGLYALNKLLPLQRDKLRLEGELGQTRGDIARLDQQREEARLQIDQLVQKFREDAAHDLADTRSRLSDVREKLAIAGDVLTRIEIRAPVAGVVQNLRSGGVGGVVKAGETIADLVPVGDSLIVAAQVSPLDIDSVVPGQTAELKFTSFSSRRMPSLFGRVESVSADAMFNDTTKQSYYLARVIVDRSSIPTAIASKLTPGMPADVLIVTGERSMLDYLIGPLAAALSKGMREE